MNCTQEQLPEVLRIAEVLKVKGLTEVSLMKQSTSESNISNLEEHNDDRTNGNEEEGAKDMTETESVPQKQLKSNECQM